MGFDRNNLPEPDGMSVDELVNARSLLAKIGTVLAGAAVVGFCVGHFYGDKLGGFRIPLAVIAWILALIAAIAIGTVIALAKTVRRAKAAGGNYFLYDALYDRNIDVNSLSLTRARERVHLLMTKYAKQGRNMYLYNLFDEKVGIPDSYKPLFCYDILMSLSEGSSNALCRNVLGYGKDFADTFAKYLGYAEDGQTAEKLAGFIAAFESDRDRTELELARYAKDNHGIFEKNFMEYLRNHIREFD